MNSSASLHSPLCAYSASVLSYSRPASAAGLRGGVAAISSPHHRMRGPSLTNHQDVDSSCPIGDGGGEADAGEEVSGGLVVACGDTAQSFNRLKARSMMLRLLFRGASSARAVTNPAVAATFWARNWIAKQFRSQCSLGAAGACRSLCALS